MLIAWIRTYLSLACDSNAVSRGTLTPPPRPYPCPSPPPSSSVCLPSPYPPRYHRALFIWFMAIILNNILILFALLFVDVDELKKSKARIGYKHWFQNELGNVLIKEGIRICVEVLKVSHSNSLHPLPFTVTITLTQAQRVASTLTTSPDTVTATPLDDVSNAQGRGRPGNKRKRGRGRPKSVRPVSTHPPRHHHPPRERISISKLYHIEEEEEDVVLNHHSC